MVVFDSQGKFVKSWGKEFKGGAHGLHTQREGSTEFLYLCDTKRGVVVKATLVGERSLPSATPISRRRTGRAQTASLPSTADESGDRTEWRSLRGRRVRFELHQSV
ncbi:MAG: hypothetical protein WDO73_32905 [Ignavibacteriota bacterium]